MNEQEIAKTELLLLQYAFRRPQGVAVETAAQRIGVPMAQLARAFRSLRDRELLRQDGYILHLTPLGRRWIMENQAAFAFTGEKTWRQVPDRFAAKSIPPFKPYAPRISKLSKIRFGLAAPKERK